VRQFVKKMSSFALMVLFTTKYINTNVHVSLEQRMMNNVQRTSAFDFLQFLSSVVFTSITARVGLNLSSFNNLFLWRNDGDIDVLYKYCTWKFLVVRCPVGHRPMLSCTCTDAGWRPHDLWPRTEIMLKFLRCPADFQFAGELHWRCSEDLYKG